MSKASKTEQDAAIAQLRKWLKPGDTVLTILRHCSKSGMTRDIGVVVAAHDKSGTFLHPNYAVATALGWPRSPGNVDGIRTSGCGMDMGFNLVYNLSRVLFPDGFGEVPRKKVGDCFIEYPRKRPKTKKAIAARLAQGYTFHGRNGDTSGWDNDGGYALNHRWL